MSGLSGVHLLCLVSIPSHLIFSLVTQSQASANVISLLELVHLACLMKQCIKYSIKQMTFFRYQKDKFKEGLRYRRSKTQKFTLCSSCWQSACCLVEVEDTDENTADDGNVGGTRCLRLEKLQTLHHLLLVLFFIEEDLLYIVMT